MTRQALALSVVLKIPFSVKILLTPTQNQGSVKEYETRLSVSINNKRACKRM